MTKRSAYKAPNMLPPGQGRKKQFYCMDCKETLYNRPSNTLYCSECRGVRQECNRRGAMARFQERQRLLK